MKKQAFNPYLPAWEYVPDGEPHVFGDRLYIFGSHDNAKGKDFCQNDYVCWSAPTDDLSDWRYDGVIYRKTQHPGNDGTNVYFAPDVAQGPDGKYYLYYFVANSSVISVAVCDTPAGNYEYLDDVHLPNGHVLGSAKEDWFQFDPAVLVDDDGRIWLYSGSGQKSNGRFGHPVVGCFVMELEQDMVTVKAGPKLLLPANESRKEPNFFEGASIRHIGEWYYLVYPTTDITGLNYSMSRYPDRDFEYRGRIHSTSDIGFEGRGMNQARYPIGNNHGGLVCVQGQWYIFDHRMTNHTIYQRQGVAEPVTIAEDGTIAMVESTSCGLNGGILAGKGEYPAYIACNLMSKKVFGMSNPMATPYVTQDEEDYDPPCQIKGESASGKEPEVYLKDMKNGRVAGYKYFDFQGTTMISVTLRGKAKGTMIVSTKEEGNAAAEILVDCSSDQWQTFHAPLSVDDGKSALYFCFHGKGTLDMLKFELS